jgi:25S rRNA (cytosine2278-C5)-methyltransferase
MSARYTYVHPCPLSSAYLSCSNNSHLINTSAQLTPVIALLLVHDFLLSKKGIALPASHGLRTAIERHKARLTAELTRSRLRRKVGSIDTLRQLVAVQSLIEAGAHPRWVRLNTIKTTLQEQLDTTFKDFTRVTSVDDVIRSTGKAYYVDEHVPNLLALSPLFEITKTHAYATGAIILQDKASCFPAYLLDPHPEDGDVIDSCAAPGNKTTHVAALVQSHVVTEERKWCPRKVYAFEKDPHRARTLEKMVNLAGAQDITTLSLGQDFLRVDPQSPQYKDVGALLLDPSCSGSGIVGRDAMPTIHLPEQPGAAASKKSGPGLDKNRKRKRETAALGEDEEERKQVLVDDDGKELVVSSEKEMRARLEALSSFQMTLLLHAFTFPAARRVTYSTCSIHAEENENVVVKALQSDVAVRRGWRILKREQQVQGMRKWPVRGNIKAADGNEEVADACIRSYKDDGRGVMGFFVAGFVRDPSIAVADGAEQETAAVGITKQEGGMEDDADGSDADEDEWGGFDD